MLTSLFITGLSFLLEGYVNINIIVLLQVSIFFTGILLLKHTKPLHKSLHVVTDLTLPLEENAKIFPIYASKEKTASLDE